MEQAVVKFAKALVFVGMFQQYFVGEPEEEESEGLSWDKVEVWFITFAFTRLGFLGAMKGGIVLFHLLELMYDRGVELVLVSEVILEVAVG
jgi:hypothetical protein